MSKMSLNNFVPHAEFVKDEREGFLKTDSAFPIGNGIIKYLWINCDICGHRVNIYELVNGLWLCPKCVTVINNIEKRLTAVRCDNCHSRLIYCKSKTHHWWKCNKCDEITKRKKLIKRKPKWITT